MNRQRIYEIITSPGNLVYERDLPVVKGLIESFPYFPASYAMMSKLMHDENSIYFDKNLKLGAAYIGNREILYHYIKDQKREEAQLPPLVISDEITDNEIINDRVATDSPNPVINEEPVPEVVQDSISASLVSAEEPETATETEITETASIAAEISEDNQTKNPEPLEKEIHSLQTLEKEMMPYVAYDYFAEHLKKERKKLSIEEDVVVNQESAGEDLSVVSENQVHGFSEWFELLGALVQKQVKSIETPVSKSTNSGFNSLIDKFIQAEPRIKPQQTKMYNPEDMARQSAKEDLSIATETLANIYLKQGLNHKAIEIFQQLILKYPQKSGYFADKIREIESESHS